jgi:hypothetical protein
MRRWRTSIGLALTAALLANAAPAGAGGSAPAVDFGNLLPPPADTGKAPTRLPPVGLESNKPAGCLPELPCGTRLLGTIRKDGAVELQVPAWRW